MTVKPEGEVEVVIGTVSQGQGHETSFAQLINEWLGVPHRKRAAGHRAIPIAFRWAAARIRDAGCGWDRS